MLVDCFKKMDSFYLALSALFALIAFSFLENAKPWIDEVMFSDMSMHYAKGMGWSTFAFYSKAKEIPFMFNMPLYTITLGFWMKIFGISLEASRSLNIVLTFFIGYYLLCFQKKMSITYNYFQVTIFSLLLWFSSDMIFMWRDGRPDLIGALFFILFLIKVVDYHKVKSKKVQWQLIAYAALMTMAGIQNAVYLVLLLLLGVLILKTKRKQLFNIIVLAVCGDILGFIIAVCFMAYHGHLMGFLENIASFIGPLRTIATLVLPYLGEPMGLDTSYYMQKLSTSVETEPLIGRIVEIFSNPAFSILVLVNILSLIILWKKKIIESSGKIAVYFLIMAIFAPILMNLAGRFRSYYFWMAWLPLIISTSILFEWKKNKLTFVFISFALVFTISHGLKYLSQKGEEDELHAFFVKYGHLIKDQKVVAPFETFYEMGSLTNYTYYAEIYTKDYIPNDIAYIILPKQEKGSIYNAQYYQYFECLNKMSVLELQAEDINLGLKLYKVKQLIHD